MWGVTSNGAGAGCGESRQRSLRVYCVDGLCNCWFVSISPSSYLETLTWCVCVSACVHEHTYMYSLPESSCLLGHIFGEDRELR